MDNLTSLPRSKAEQDFHYKQLVAYNVIRSENAFLTYRRTEKSSESRLWKKYSLGVGGHINVDDKAQVTLFKSSREKSMNFFTQTVWRELDEEIILPSSSLREPELICFINDDSNEVGRVHFGLVWLLDIELRGVVKGKRGLAELRFCEIEDLMQEKEFFETWSQLIIDYFSKNRFSKKTA